MRISRISGKNNCWKKNPGCSSTLACTYVLVGSGLVMLVCLYVHVNVSLQLCFVSLASAPICRKFELGLDCQKNIYINAGLLIAED